MNSENREYYKARFKFDKDRKIVWKAINEYLTQFIDEQSHIMDLGCGYGDFINGIEGLSKFAIDLNIDNKKYLDPDVTFFPGSVLDPFPVKNESLDVIFASNLFEHFDDIELDLLIKNVYEKLKKGGKLILIQPNIRYSYREYWDDYTHKKAFSHESIRDFLVASSFSPVQVEKKFIPFSMKSKLPKSYFLTKLYLSLPIRPLAKQMLIVVQKI